MLHHLLEAEGYEVTDISTCQDAPPQTQTRPFDAVLLNMGLPDGDGLSVLSQLKETTPSLPVIMLTAARSTHQRTD